MTSHWDELRQHWSCLGSPLRPPAEAVQAYERELGLADCDVVLLGVTPELAGLGRTLVAVDQSAGMIAGVWPGDSASRKAMVGDWFHLPFHNASVTAIIADGCLPPLGSSQARMALFAEIARMLRPGGRAGLRSFCALPGFEDLRGLRDLALAGRISSFHELKLRIGMAGSSDDRERAIPVRAIRAAFDKLFSQRDILSEVTGWDPATIGTIDAYAHSDAIYSFATAEVLREEAADFFEDVRMAESGAYPFAQQCPLLILGAPS